MSMPADSLLETRRRLRIELTGALHGAAFRPFMHRLAIAEGLSGFMRDTRDGVTIELEGPPDAIARCLVRLDVELPPPATITGRATSRMPATGQPGFAMIGSMGTALVTAQVLPDLVTCPDCLAEIFDPSARLYLYPFAACSHCGPRYSITESLPQDRAHTIMRHFQMCPACLAEYEDPDSRRFRALGNGCPECGPELVLLEPHGRRLDTGLEALAAAAEVIRSGAVVALKGLGGYQLVCDARDAAAVGRLRRAKQRPDLPLAVMVTDVAVAERLADIDASEAALLGSSAGPIVLARKASGAGMLAEGVAPGSGLVGLMLPTTPLHHILARELAFPLVVTSANRGGEPVLFDGNAEGRLSNLCDLVLTHDRPIVRPVEDSVVRVIAGQPTTLRLGRGLAPLTLPARREVFPTLALGGKDNAAIALAAGHALVLGPHIGGLGGAAARVRLDVTANGLAALFHVAPRAVAADTNPAYLTTRLADATGLPLRRAPHHLAHILSAMADNGLEGPVLGFAWDGPGHGDGGAIWGGETVLVDAGRWTRLASLKPFRLPGGEARAGEPARCALGLLFALEGQGAFARIGLPPVEAFSGPQRKAMATMLASGLDAPVTSSIALLCDAVAALLGLGLAQSFEGQAALALEYAASRAVTATPLPAMVLAEADGLICLDWEPTIAAILDAHAAGVEAAPLALGFHLALADTILAVAARLGQRDIVLTGRCFENGLLAQLAVDRLQGGGFTAWRHARVPPNDGGLALGQAVFAAAPPVDGDEF